MTTITFIEADGTRHEVQARNDRSLMQAAVQNAVPGIDADCGGKCLCATCHVYVDPAFMDKVGEQQEMEKSMLDFAENVTANSRLSCQIKVSDALEGLVVQLPAFQM